MHRVLLLEFVTFLKGIQLPHQGHRGLIGRRRRLDGGIDRGSVVGELDV
jgi:hypothetical protein